MTRRPTRSRERRNDVGRLVADTLRHNREQGCTCNHADLLDVSYDEPVHVTINHVDDCPVAVVIAEIDDVPEQGFDAASTIVTEAAGVDCECDPDARTVEVCRIGGVAIIPGAYQCTTCYRRVDESLI